MALCLVKSKLTRRQIVEMGGISIGDKFMYTGQSKWRPVYTINRVNKQTQHKLQYNYGVLPSLLYTTNYKEN